MTVNLTPDAQAVVEELVISGSYASADEAVSALILQRRRARSDEDAAAKAARQKAAGKRLLEKLKSMPTEPTPDGKTFSGRDHDQILYGGDW